MLLRRKILFAFSLIVYAGSLTAALGYAWYLRCDHYRSAVQAQVSEFLGMPTRIGEISPRGLRTRRLGAVNVALPGGQAQVFHCAEAVWRGGSEAVGNTLSLADGWFVVGRQDFSPQDYDSLIRGGLGGDFARFNLQRIDLSEMRLNWSAADLALAVDGASGQVNFGKDGLGRAQLTAARLNDYAVKDPLRISAVFTPGGELRVHALTLQVPVVDLSAMRLDDLLGGPVTQGAFAGTISYAEEVTGTRTVLAGRVSDAALGELTRSIAGTRLDGTVDVDISHAEFVDRRLATLEFSGGLTGVRLGNLARLFDEPALDATIDLDVRAGYVEADRLRRLDATGRASGLSMEVLSRLLLGGRVTGTLEMTVEALNIVDERIAQAVIRLDVKPPVKDAGTIDRAIIVQAARELLDVDLGSAEGWLPEEVEYARMGVTLLVEDDTLRLGGTHGDDGRTMLTVRVWGGEIGLVRAPRRSWPVGNVAETIRSGMSAVQWRALLRRFRVDQPAPPQPIGDEQP